MLDVYKNLTANYAVNLRPFNSPAISIIRILQTTRYKHNIKTISTYGGNLKFRIYILNDNCPHLVWRQSVHFDSLYSLKFKCNPTKSG